MVEGTLSDALRRSLVSYRLYHHKMLFLSQDLKISEMDEWIDSDDESSDSEGDKDKEKEDSDSGTKKKNKKKGTLIY